MNTGWTGLVVRLLVGLAVTGAALLVASPAQALSPPEAEKAEVVLVSGGRVVSIAADGSGRRVLSRPGPLSNGYMNMNDYSPSISPDGSSLLYSRSDERDYSSKIIVADRDGSDARAVLTGTRGPNQYMGATWAFDGSRIFLIRYTERVNSITSGISSIRPDGSGYRVVNSSIATFTKKGISGDPDFPVTISAAPDGERLLVGYVGVSGFVGLTDTSTAKTKVVDIDTGARSLLKRDAFAAQFSPGGDRIVFASERERRNKHCYEGCSYDSQIFVMDADGSNVRRLMPKSWVRDSSSPSWAADSSQIVFSAHTRYFGGTGSDEIFSVKPGGRCLTRLTNGSPDSDSPSWGPEAGRSPDPGACGDVAPDPLVEVTPGPSMLGLTPKPLWLGPAFGDLLLSDLFLDGRSMSESYNDCGAPKSDGCPARVQIESASVCDDYSPDPLAFSFAFLRVLRARGGLVMKLRPSKRGALDSVFYSGGTVSQLITPDKVAGRPVRFAQHLAMIRRLRPIDSVDLPDGDLSPAVFPWPDVRRARRFEAAVRRGDAGRLSRTDRAYLRFARSLRRIGPVRTVKCHGNRNLPGTVKFR